MHTLFWCLHVLLSVLYWTNVSGPNAYLSTSGGEVVAWDLSGLSTDMHVLLTSPGVSYHCMVVDWPIVSVWIGLSELHVHVHVPSGVVSESHNIWNQCSVVLSMHATTCTCNGVASLGPLRCLYIGVCTAKDRNPQCVYAAKASDIVQVECWCMPHGVWRSRGAESG